VVVNYMRDHQISLGLPREQVYNQTMYILAAMLVIGLICNLLVRPVAIGLATWGLDFSLPQRALLAWLAPRGIVTAAVASLFAIRL
jgi:NhaP-type Na+/H+ or K+/H+ antiporter